MFDWIISQIPWYVPVAIVVILCIIFWQFIAPFWLMLPRWAQTAIGMVALVAVAMQYGRNRGAAGERARRKSLNEKAVAQRDLIDEKVRNMPPNAVTRQLERRGWLRE